MNWEAVGAIAELLGSVAVLLTLIYLAVQVRNSRELLEENKKLSQSQAYQGRASYRREVHVALTQPAFIKAAEKVFDGEANRFATKEDLARFQSLSFEERTTYVNTVGQWTVMMDDAVLQIELGLFDDYAIENAVSFLSNSYAWWIAIGIVPSVRLQKWCEENNIPMELGT